LTVRDAQIIDSIRLVCAGVSSSGRQNACIAQVEQCVPARFG
jgi:hypothetical protein